LLFLYVISFFLLQGRNITFGRTKVKQKIKGEKDQTND
jgi:hypothetical protein